MIARQATEYFCEKHDFKTTDPRKAVKHIQGDLVDTLFEALAKVAKAQMGLV